jgi:exosortase
VRLRIDRHGVSAVVLFVVTLNEINLKVWLPVAAFAVLWLDLFRELSSQWEAREQYAYGWFVPFFAVALLWRRRADQPPAQAQRPSIALWGVVLLLSGALLPLRVIYEINPDWPLLSWVYTLIVVGVSLFAFYLAGGWPWVRNYAFPVAFVLVAVAWPWRIEKGLTQGLMRIVAGLTVEVLDWCGIPAMQKGNLIELSTGTVGVDEACSGIRSFQSGVMAALVMGEFYRLRIWARLGLLGIGLTLAFGFNVMRTLFLSWQANQHGLAMVGKWHDPAGLTITVLCFLGLWSVAGHMQSKSSAQPPPANGPSQGRFPGLFLACVGCWAIGILVLNEWWYRSHEIKESGVFHWSASFPTNNPGFARLELTDTVRRNLKEDAGEAATWQADQGSTWTAFFFRWNPGPVRSIISARQHRPDICLPAAGLRQVADAGLNYFEVGGLKLPFREYTYSSSGTTLQVFFCQWEDGTERQMGMWGSTLADRVRAAVVGRRHLGQQSLEMILSGYESLHHAEQALAKQLPSLIHIVNPAAQSGVSPAVVKMEIP